MLQNITFSAEAEMIKKARQVAKSQGSTLNKDFRVWLQSRVADEDNAAQKRGDDFIKLVREFDGIKFDGPLTREEANARR